jgi:amicyanin
LYPNDNTIPSGTTTNPVVTSTPTSTVSSTSPGASVKTEQAKIKNYSFQPKIITIKAGSTVVWTNYDNVGHTVTSDDGTFDSGTISQNQTYSRKFSVPGSFTYHCTPHPYMEGTVIVQ